MILFLKSFLMGLAIAAPVGPIAVICINRTLNRGFLSGLSTGLGAATADAFYSAIIGFGLTAVSDYLILHKNLIHILGGIILCVLAIKIFFSRSNVVQSNQKGDYFSALILTLTNPMTIIAFIAIFSGLGIGTIHPQLKQATTVIIGIFMGSFVWWLFLSVLIGAFNRKINSLAMRWINIFSALVILGFGVFILLFSALLGYK